MYGMYVKGYTSLLIKANSNQRQPSDLASCCLRERLHSATQLKVNESTTSFKLRPKRADYIADHLVPDQYERRHTSIDTDDWAETPFTH